MPSTLSDYRSAFLCHWRGLLAATALLISSAPIQADQPTLLVLGDSLSASYGLSDPAFGWVALLGNELTPKLRVINASISGDTSAGGLTRLPALIQQYQPDTILIELGGNDGLRGYPLTGLRSQLTALVQLAKNATNHVVLIEMKIPPNYGKRYTEKFTQIYSDIANEQNITLMPFFLAGITQQDGMMQADGIHPTERAQPLIKEAVKATLLPLLESTQNQAGSR